MTRGVDRCIPARELAIYRISAEIQARVAAETELRFVERELTYLSRFRWSVSAAEPRKFAC